MSKETSDEWVEKAKGALSNGPLTIKQLAEAIGHPNSRSLSMVLQYHARSVQNYRGKWRLAVFENAPTSNERKP